MQVDLIYIYSEDRMILKCSNTRLDVYWLITRGLLIRLIKILIVKLEQVGLPSVPEYLPNLPRRIELEHYLALEYDGPQKKNISIQEINLNASHLLLEVNLLLSSIKTQLILKGKNQKATLIFSRRETHAFIDMLYQKSYEVGWLAGTEFTEWLTKRKH